MRLPNTNAQHKPQSPLLAPALRHAAVAVCPIVSGYTARAGVDHSYDDIRFVSSTNVAVIAAACSADDRCSSFNFLRTNVGGWIKTAADVTRAGDVEPDFCFYVKNGESDQ